MIRKVATRFAETRLDDELVPRFAGRLLAITEVVAQDWGDLVAARANEGRPIGSMDALLAATARVHELTLVTRDEADFRGTVGSIVNPWAR